MIPLTEVRAEPALALEAAEERREACAAILDTCMAERRDRLASEQRSFDKYQTELGELARLESSYRAKRDRTEAEARDARNKTPGFRQMMAGTADTLPGSRDDRLGADLARAVDEVMSGKRAVAHVESRAVTEGGDGEGLVPVDLRHPVSTLRARSIVMGLPGINVVGITADRVRFPRLDVDTVLGVGENSSLTESDGDITSVDILTTKFGALRTLSSEVVEDAPVDVLAAVGDNLLSALALKVDLEMLQGTGAGPGLVGLRNTPGITTTSVAASLTDFDKPTDAVYALRNNNAVPAVWIMHPRSWKQLSEIKTGLTSDKTTLLQRSPQLAADTLLGLPVKQSTQITLTEGAGAGSWIAVVDPTQLVIAERRPPVFEVSRHYAWSTDALSIRVTARYGFGVLNAGAVSILTDVR